MTPVNGIYGIGDSANKKEAEKLAALSSLLQLINAGYVSLFISLFSSLHLATNNHLARTKQSLRRPQRPEQL